MNREILFRGKRKDNGEWVYGSLQCFKGVSIFDRDVKNFIAVHPETIGQYTGLTDKNGKKIFEGDILLAELTEGVYACFKFPIGMVVFSGGSFCMKSHKNTTPLSSYSYNVSFEVIGNIYDNPELLS